MDLNRNVLHVINFPTGHTLSSDCWCEPAKIYWNKDGNGTMCLMIEHHDDTPNHHKVIVNERNRRLDWITRSLNEVRYFAPPSWYDPPDDLLNG